MAAVDIVSQMGRPTGDGRALRISPSHLGQFSSDVTHLGEGLPKCYTHPDIILDLFFKTPKYARSGQLGQFPHHSHNVFGGDRF